MKDTVYRADRYLTAKIETVKRNLEEADYELDGIVDADTIRRVKEAYRQELAMLEHLESLNEREM